MSSTSRWEAYVVWWSSSALVTTAIVGASLSRRAVGLVGLDHEPLRRRPSRRWSRSRGPRRRPGSGPAASRSAWTIIARRRRLAVGAGDGDRRLQARELAQQVGAVQLAAPAVVRSGLSGGDRARVDDLGARRARWPRRGRSSARCPALSGPPYGESAARSEPVTSRRARARPAASPLMPGAADADEVQSAS